MNNIWFTSDTHFGHANIAGPSVSQWKTGYRNYASVKDMNDAIVNSINNNVKPNDTLYHLGDWSFGGHDNVPLFRGYLNVKNIILIEGNHDKYTKLYRGLFTDIYRLFEFRYSKKCLFVMCHYALRVWNKSHHGSYHLYGHSHHSLPEFGRSMDVGWCKYRRPLHIDEVICTLSNRQIEFVDHHSQETSE